MGKKFIVLSIVFALLLVAVTSVSAITNGQPDGDEHPYVGVVFDLDQTHFCSGSAISPDVFITAAHCFNDGDIVSLTFESSPGDLGAEVYYGFVYQHPDYCPDCGPGLHGAFQNDIAVISPLVNADLASPDLDRYGQLPALGLVDTLRNQTAVTLVGFGFQDFITGGGPPVPTFDETRHVAQAKLQTGSHNSGESFIKLSARQGNDQGGFCFGDSGGPVLLGETDLILALSAFSPNDRCAGVTYTSRIDTESALNFINGFNP